MNPMLADEPASRLLDLAQISHRFQNCLPSLCSSFLHSVTTCGKDESNAWRSMFSNINWGEKDVAR